MSSSSSLGSFLYKNWTTLPRLINSTKIDKNKSEDVEVPYRLNHRLGLVLDFDDMEPGKHLVTSDLECSSEKVNVCTARYSVIRSVGDVCELLQIPPEYALKVQAGIVDDTILGEGLKDVYRQDSCITIMFRIVFLHELNYLKQADTEERFTGLEFTHYISAVAIGNELVAILKLSTADPKLGNLDNFSEKVEQIFIPLQCGALDDTVFSKLENFAMKSEKKFKKPVYQDMKCSVLYGCFSNEEMSGQPATFTGMVSALKEFKSKCENWMTLAKRAASAPSIFKVDPNKVMHVENTTFAKGRPSDTKTSTGCFDGIDKVMYNTRVMLRSCNPEAVDCDKLSEIYFQSETAKVQLQAFLDSDPFIPNARAEERDGIVAAIQDLNSKLLDTIQHLDLVTDFNRLVKPLGELDPLGQVDDYIHRTTTQLPPGGDLNLLLIGKTGHGKSSTGNNILGQQKFKASCSMDSTTVVSEYGYATVDGRTLKVIDTPGMCDTKVSIKGNIKAMSRAISLCGNGFHALMICLKFGTKMTDEERLAIEILRKIFGEDVFKDYCIFVFTGGDHFKTEFKDKTMSFEDWCRQEQNSEMKALFEQCKYRCVLINNKEEDPTIMKSQIIRLITTVDNVSPDGELYTNQLFQFAHEARNKIIQKYHLPKLFEGVISNLELILGAINKFDESKSEDQSGLQEEMEKQANSLLEKLSEDTDRPEIEEVRLLMTSILEVISSGKNEETNEKIKEISPKLKVIFEKMKTISDDLNKQVQASVEPEVASSSCFPGSSQVVVKNGVKLVKDLEVGDEVLVRGALGEVFFDTVYMFGHRDADPVETFVVLHTGGDQDGGGNSVFASRGHLVYCVRDGVELCLPAKDVRLNDELLTLASTSASYDASQSASRVVSHDASHTAIQSASHGTSQHSNGGGCAVALKLKLKLKPKFKRAPVVRISLEEKRGVYAPFTKSGTIVVDGCLMSCYVDVLPHRWAHAFLAPLRLLYDLSPAALIIVNGGKNNRHIFPFGRIALKLVSHV